ncbi:galactosylgalactosylxylosylprotein 3-beta-glucuronosyltransferase 1-like [Bombina bombina]|uniref:galactosylgalactosylxylosylprotein 3-beta-glucuronosyltransferase 1-like n=1 Tax=Bombina bombina TaxID=8345 RepID=UPI00235A915F|nr:galactosylgalactosylxylosylprotein 3-beta-glucuronosyltransferase 1-like [Bombina bombina]
MLAFKDYYDKLYNNRRGIGDPNPADIADYLSDLHLPRLTTEQNETLDAPISEEELLETISSLPLGFSADKVASRPLPIIFVITPTYTRIVQKAELTRMANTLRHVPALHWIVVEDSKNKTPLVTNFLRTSKVQYTQLCVMTPKGVKKARGTLQRNIGLSWLRETFYPDEAPEGVVYFGDDDNTYSLEVFEEMRYTKKVSVWPVAFVGGLRFESLKLDTAGKVKGFAVKYASLRRFAIDMAGFAINLKLILEKPRAMFRLDVKGGYQETSLLESLVNINDLEPKAKNCTKVLVWHTKTLIPNINSDKNFTSKTIEV